MSIVGLELHSQNLRPWVTSVVLLPHVAPRGHSLQRWEHKFQPLPNGGCPTGGLVRGITAGLCCGSCIPSFTTKVCIGEEYTNAPNLLSPRWGRNSIDSSVQPLSATNYTGIIFNPSNKYKHTYTVPRTFDPGPRSLRMTCRAVWDMSPVTGRGASMARHKARMDRPMGPRPSERRASGVQGKG